MKDKEILKMYRRSIILDLLIFGIPLFILFIFEVFILLPTSQLQRYLLWAPNSILLFLIFFSDLVSFPRSIGKRLMGIEVVSSSALIPIRKSSLLHRRFLDLYLAPVIGKNFYEKSLRIDEVTKTKIQIKK